MMSITKSLLAAVGVLCLGGIAHAADEPLWMRYPAISPNGQEIAFAYKGDIYKVSASGGQAIRLTTNEAYESQPLWSPDGSQIAFVSDRYQGSMDVYVMSANGGGAKRVTTHSTSTAPLAFSPDGKYIYYMAHIQDPASSVIFPMSRLNEVYKVPVAGGRTTLEIPTPVSDGEISKDGRFLLYEDTKGMENMWRKHHTSSVTKDIYLYDFKNKSYEQLVSWKGEDRNPVYAPDGNHFYFLSERAGTFNVFKQPLSSKGEASATQLTSFDIHPVRFLSVANNGTLCFGYDGKIYTMREGSAPTKVNISILNDLDESQSKKLTFTRGVTSASVSPDGKMVAYIVRGEVFVASTDYSTTKRITNTAAMERGVSFGGDNRSIVYESLRGGQSDLYIAKMARSNDPNFANATLIDEQKLIPGDKSEKMYPQFSPDGKEIAFVKDRRKIAIYNVESGKVREVYDGRHTTSKDGGINFTWSPDSKWIALELVDNHHEPFTDIVLMDAKSGKLTNITQSGYFNSNPRFVMGGNAIIYASEEYGMRNHASWGSMSDVMIVFLNREAYDKYRLNEEEYELMTEEEKKAKEADKSEEKDKKSDDKKDDAKGILVELDNIKDRIVRLTPASSNLGDAYITKDGKKLYYMAAFEGGYDLWVMDLRKGDNKLLKKLDGSYAQFQPDAKESNLFFISSGSIQKMNLSSEKMDRVSVRAEMDLNAEAEREFMFDFMKKEEQERFYVKDMHGVDWEFMTKEYRKFLPHINNNYDFSEMLSEILGELNVSHTGSGYGAPNRADKVAETGLFFDLSVATDEGLKIEEVIVGGPFDTHLSKVKAGDFLAKIDGVEITKDTDFFPLLAGKAGKNVLFTFYSPETGKTYEEVVKPISSGRLSGLLYERWVKQRAAEVDRLSNGRLGYVHISSMDDASFRRMYADAMGKYYQREGLVVDIRYNGGGRLHEDIEVFLSGTKYLTQEIRGEYYCDMPSKRWTKPSVMVICEADYSNAHGSPWVYKHMGIGKLVGMPVPGTMTSVNWVTLQDPSVYFGIPAVGYKTAEGYYLENFELEPDVKVRLDFKKALNGQDSQMEAAVKELLK